MNGAESSRRRVLRRGGQALATGLAATLAGCSGGVLPGGGQSGGSSGTDATSGDSGGAGTTAGSGGTGTTAGSGGSDANSGRAALVEWVPARGEAFLPQPTFRQVDLPALRAVEGSLPESTFERWASLPRHEATLPSEAFGVERSALRTRLDLQRPTGVYTGQFDPSAVREALSGRFTEVETHDGVTLYRREGDRGYYAAGVGDDHLLYHGPHWQAEDPSATAVLRDLVDAGTGTEKRAVAQSDHLDTLATHLGSAPVVVGRVRGPSEPVQEGNPEEGIFAGQVAAGRALDLGEEETRVRRVRVLADAGDVSEDAVSTWAASAEALSEVSTTVDGRAVTLSGVRPTGTL